MRTPEFPTWPFPGTCDLWECSNRDCNYWGGGPTGTRGVCRCAGLLDLCRWIHGYNSWLDGKEGYITGDTGTAPSMSEAPHHRSPITYRVVVFDRNGVYMC